MSNGRRIRTVDRVCKLAEEGRAICHLYWDKHCPAAFVVSMQARVVNMMVTGGMLYEMPKKANKK